MHEPVLDPRGISNFDVACCRSYPGGCAVRTWNRDVSSELECLVRSATGRTVCRAGFWSLAGRFVAGHDLLLLRGTSRRVATKELDDVLSVDSRSGAPLRRTCTQRAKSVVRTPWVGYTHNTKHCLNYQRVELGLVGHREVPIPRSWASGSRWHRETFCGQLVHLCPFDAPLRCGPVGR